MLNILAGVVVYVYCKMLGVLLFHTRTVVSDSHAKSVKHLQTSTWSHPASKTNGVVKALPQSERMNFFCKMCFGSMYNRWQATVTRVFRMEALCCHLTLVNLSDYTVTTNSQR